MTDYKAYLQRLQHGEDIGNAMRGELRRAELIRAQDVTPINSATREREWLFLGFTDAGRTVLES